jgi:hypothetical protein
MADRHSLPSAAGKRWDSSPRKFHRIETVIICYLQLLPAHNLVLNLVLVKKLYCMTNLMGHILHIQMLSDS